MKNTTTSYLYFVWFSTILFSGTTLRVCVWGGGVWAAACAVCIRKFQFHCLSPSHLFMAEQTSFSLLNNIIFPSVSIRIIYIYFFFASSFFGLLSLFRARMNASIFALSLFLSPTLLLLRSLVLVSIWENLTVNSNFVLCTCERADAYYCANSRPAFQNYSDPTSQWTHTHTHTRSACRLFIAIFAVSGSKRKRSYTQFHVKWRRRRRKRRRRRRRSGKWATLRGVFSIRPTLEAQVISTQSLCTIFSHFLSCPTVGDSFTLIRTIRWMAISIWDTKLSLHKAHDMHTQWGPRKKKCRKRRRFGHLHSFN